MNEAAGPGLVSYARGVALFLDDYVMRAYFWTIMLCAPRVCIWIYSAVRTARTRVSPLFGSLFTFVCTMPQGHGLHGARCVHQTDSPPPVRRVRAVEKAGDVWGNGAGSPAAALRSALQMSEAAPAGVASLRSPT